MLLDDIDFLSKSKKNNSNLRIINASIKSQKFVHAYMFYGNNIELLTRLSFYFAASINCREGGCGKCRVCANTLKGIYENMMVVEPDGNNILKNKIVELQAFMSKSSYSEGYKVCIIKEADLMNKPAANRLLKTLEDPPDDKSIFILLTENISKVMATISSRCMVFEWDFGDQDKINLNFDAEALSDMVLDGIKNIMREPRDYKISLDLSYGVIKFLKDNTPDKSDDFEIKLNDFRNTGATNSEIKKFETTLKAKRKRKQDRYFNLGINMVFDIITAWIADMLAVKIGTGRQSLDFPDSYEFIKENVGYLYDKEVYKLLDIIEKNRYYLKFSITHELALDNIFSQLQALCHRSKTKV